MKTQPFYSAVPAALLAAASLVAGCGSTAGVPSTSSGTAEEQASRGGVDRTGEIPSSIWQACSDGNTEAEIDYFIDTFEYLREEGVSYTEAQQAVVVCDAITDWDDCETCVNEILDYVYETELDDQGSEQEPDCRIVATPYGYGYGIECCTYSGSYFSCTTEYHYD